MKFEKLNIIKFENGKKIIILEKIEYENKIYLYVDDVNEDETDTLDTYYIMRINDNGTLTKEKNPDILAKIIPIFGDLVEENYN